MRFMVAYHYQKAMSIMNCLNREEIVYEVPDKVEAGPDQEELIKLLNEKDWTISDVCRCKYIDWERNDIRNLAILVAIEQAVHIVDGRNLQVANPTVLLFESQAERIKKNG